LPFFLIAHPFSTYHPTFSCLLIPVGFWEGCVQKGAPFGTLFYLFDHHGLLKDSYKYALLGLLEHLRSQERLSAKEP
jgi:hypothetical protein